MDNINLDDMTVSLAAKLERQRDHGPGDLHESCRNLAVLLIDTRAQLQKQDAMIKQLQHMAIRMSDDPDRGPSESPGSGDTTPIMLGDPQLPWTRARAAEFAKRFAIHASVDEFAPVYLETATDPSWQPHAWVTDAVFYAAIEIGQEAQGDLKTHLQNYIAHLIKSMKDRCRSVAVELGLDPAASWDDVTNTIKARAAEYNDLMRRTANAAGWEDGNSPEDWDAITNAITETRDRLFASRDVVRQISKIATGGEGDARADVVIAAVSALRRDLSDALARCETAERCYHDAIDKLNTANTRLGRLDSDLHEASSKLRRLQPLIDLIANWRNNHPGNVVSFSFERKVLEAFGALLAKESTERG